MPERQAEFVTSYERVDDINAEHWEQLARDLPPSMETVAQQYREIAKLYRESESQAIVRVVRQRDETDGVS
ncbi:MAG TPA: hypothetical protein VLI55_10230 [Bryobacteraceae bacterium]|nr:hypothetical protein [Bryobacteraceae bacterium]